MLVDDEYFLNNAYNSDIYYSDQWTKVANLFSGEIWAKFEIPINVCTQVRNFVHLKS